MCLCIMVGNVNIGGGGDKKTNKKPKRNKLIFSSKCVRSRCRNMNWSGLFHDRL
jgi:hypothetical protein